ncbi:MAG: bifunctional glutamate N-acetyltransferase/amino-acid acetyltransferase ArgJ, partial [Jiangellales bacterium]
VLWSAQVLKAGQVRAVVLNSGGANACTGPEGFVDTHRTAEHVAAVLEIGAGDVAVCSTGLIGERLPMERLLAGVDVAADALHPEGGDDAARAIMTTDSVPKQAVRVGEAAGGRWTVGGMAKGAGMLAPSLATMLCVVTTDAVADAATLDAALRAATRVTLDRVDTDGCISTNDTVLLLASGASGVEPGLAELTEAVTAVCADLSRQLVDDAEGAEHIVTISVAGAAHEDEAVDVARAVGRSLLVKTAIFGRDPNWGRILGAVGSTAATFDPDRVDVSVNGVAVCRGGAAGVDRSLVDLSGREVAIDIDLGAGTEQAQILTTDLTHAYVHENSAYST